MNSSRIEDDFRAGAVVAAAAMGEKCAVPLASPARADLRREVQSTTTGHQQTCRGKDRCACVWTNKIVSSGISGTGISHKVIALIGCIASQVDPI